MRAGELIATGILITIVALGGYYAGAQVQPPANSDSTIHVNFLVTTEQVVGTQTTYISTVKTIVANGSTMLVTTSIASYIYITSSTTFTRVSNSTVYLTNFETTTNTQTATATSYSTVVSNSTVYLTNNQTTTVTSYTTILSNSISTVTCSTATTIGLSQGTTVTATNSTATVSLNNSTIVTLTC